MMYEKEVKNIEDLVGGAVLFLCLLGVKNTTLLPPPFTVPAKSRFDIDGLREKRCAVKTIKDLVGGVVLFLKLSGVAGLARTKPSSLPPLLLWRGKPD